MEGRGVPSQASLRSPREVGVVGVEGGGRWRGGGCRAKHLYGHPGRWGMGVSSKTSLRTPQEHAQVVVEGRLLEELCLQPSLERVQGGALTELQRQRVPGRGTRVSEGPLASGGQLGARNAKRQRISSGTKGSGRGVELERGV